MSFKTSTGVSALKLACLLLFLVLANPGVPERIEDLLERPGWLPPTVFVAIWASTVLAVCLTAYRASLPYRLFWGVLLSLSAAGGYLIFRITGAHVSAYSVLLYWSERAHIGDGAHAYSNLVWQAAAIAALGLLAFVLPTRRIARRSASVAALVAIAPLLPIVVVATLVVQRGGKGTDALPEQITALTLVGVYATVAGDDLHSSQRATAPAPDSTDQAVDKLVLIVDESVRGDYLDINGAQGVTPYLLSAQKQFVNFGIASAGNNCSMFSNMMLRYGGTRATVRANLMSGPSIWSYAKAAGYTTVYIDGQREAGVLQNGMTEIEAAKIDLVISREALSLLEQDREVARNIHRVLGRHEKVFVYANKTGAHFPYNRNYPDIATRFEPAMADDEPIGKSRERLINSYKNAVGYNVDGFFKVLLGRELPPSSVLIYTADHGQNLMDNGILSHCSTKAPPAGEAAVPLLVAGTHSGWMTRYAESAVQYRDTAAHANIFPTLLTAMGYDASRLKPAYGNDLAGLSDDDGIRHFSYGPIISLGKDKASWTVFDQGQLSPQNERSGTDQLGKTD